MNGESGVTDVRQGQTDAVTGNGPLYNHPIGKAFVTGERKGPVATDFLNRGDTGYTVDMTRENMSSKSIPHPESPLEVELSPTPLLSDGCPIHGFFEQFATKTAGFNAGCGQTAAIDRNAFTLLDGDAPRLVLNDQGSTFVVCS